MRLALSHGWREAITARGQRAPRGVPAFLEEEGSEGRIPRAFQGEINLRGGERRKPLGR